MKTQKLLSIVIGILFLAALLFPVKTTCGVTGATCAMPPIEGEEGAQYYYEVEPLGLLLIEALIRTNLFIYYSSGIESGNGK